MIDKIMPIIRIKRHRYSLINAMFLTRTRGGVPTHPTLTSSICVIFSAFINHDLQIISIIHGIRHSQGCTGWTGEQTLFDARFGRDLD
jgi:hypothetical protein